jgi:hypothetical protein
MVVPPEARTVKVTEPPGQTVVVAAGCVVKLHCPATFAANSENVKNNISAFIFIFYAFLYIALPQLLIRLIKT